MKRAFWYEKDFEEVIPETDHPGSEDSAIDFMENYQNCSQTENGAFGYATSGHPLVDLNFMVSSLRNRDERFIEKKFITAYYDDPEYALKWLFFLRDISEGLGERRTFRICMKYMADSHREIAAAVMELIPDYGRYDDLLVLLDTDLKSRVCGLLKDQLDKDLLAMKENRPVSLLAKWLPSINTSSKETCRKARFLAGRFGMSPREYRKTLAGLRARIDVTEVKMSASRWDEIDYEKVPAKAGIRYEEAFMRHDRDRRCRYLLDVMTGKGKLNSRGIMPCEPVHRLMNVSGYYSRAIKDDLLSELMWQQILKEGFQNQWGLEDCIVVADGSGSMYANASGSGSMKAIEICNGLAIYFAQQLKGIFHNKAITFSSRPRMIDLGKGRNLKEKLEIMLAYNEVANTNIEAVFDMLLEMAVSGNVPREEMPAQVLIISDMEFDAAAAPNLINPGEASWRQFTPALFELIEQRYKRAGYVMPRLIFWNVCGRTDTIPKVTNDQGICLLSGFSQNAIKTAANRELTDPCESLRAVLDSPRYERVSKAVAGLQLC